VGRKREGAMKIQFSKRVALTLVIAGVCFVTVSYGQSAKDEKKAGEDIKARQERIEKGITPIELGGGQPALKLSITELMKWGW